MSITKPAFTISTLTIFSRITGFIRDMLTANFLGSGLLSDVFFSAFKMANFLRKLLIHEGSFFAAFVPYFKDIEDEDSKKGTKNAVIFASKIFTVIFWFLLVVTIVMEIIMPWFTKVISPGFTGEKLELTIFLSRIVFPYFLLISLSSVLWGVLNSRGKFFYYGFVPCVMNLTVIPFLYLRGYFPTTAHCLCFGILLGGVFQLLVSYLGAWFNGDRIAISLPRKKYILDDKIRVTLKKMIPSVIGGGVTQINTMIDTVLASFIAGGVSYLYYADRLYFFPYSIVATTISVVALPLLSRATMDADKNKSLRIQQNCVKMGLILILPAAFIFILSPKQIVSIIFERGKFSSEDVVFVSNIMRFLGFGVIFSALGKIYSSVFFSHKETKIPMKISLVSVFFNVFASFIFIKPFGIYGISLATALSYLVNCTLSLYYLRKKGWLAYDLGLLKFIIICVFAALMTGLLVFGCEYLVYYKFSIFLQGIFVKLIYLAGLAFLSMLIYWLVLVCFKVNPINVIFKI